MMPKDVEDGRNNPWMRVLEMLNSFLASVLINYCLAMRFVGLGGCRWAIQCPVQPSGPARCFEVGATLHPPPKRCVGWALLSAGHIQSPPPRFNPSPEQDPALTSWLCHANWAKVRGAARNGSEPSAIPCPVSDSDKRTNVSGKLQKTQNKQMWINSRSLFLTSNKYWLKLPEQTWTNIVSSDLLEGLKCLFNGKRKSTLLCLFLFSCSEFFTSERKAQVF